MEYANNFPKTRYTSVRAFVNKVNFHLFTKINIYSLYCIRMFTYKEMSYVYINRSFCYIFLEEYNNNNSNKTNIKCHKNK